MREFWSALNLLALWQAGQVANFESGDRSTLSKLFLVDSIMYTCRLPIQYRGMKHLQPRNLIPTLTASIILLASLAFGITRTRSIMNRRNEAATIAARREHLPRLML